LKDTPVTDTQKRTIVTIRRFHATEWTKYREIRLRALKDSPDAFASTYEESQKYPEAAWIARLGDARPESDYPMAAMIGEVMVGLAWAKIEPPKLYVAHLYQMWVQPASRGNGAGRALVDAAIAWARDRNVAKLMLDVTCGDRPARRLYEAAGFVPVGTPQPLRVGSVLLEQSMELHFAAESVDLPE
jgi:GNAT superfamily N-acetyltransferase